MRLSHLYQELTPAQRVKLAEKAKISAGYLYQIATRWEGRKPTVPVMMRLVNADKRLKLADLAAEFSEQPQPKAEQ